jgi:hypothetical protein
MKGTPTPLIEVPIPSQEIGRLCIECVYGYQFLSLFLWFFYSIFELFWQCVVFLFFGLVDIPPLNWALINFSRNASCALNLTSTFLFVWVILLLPLPTTESFSLRDKFSFFAELLRVDCHYSFGHSRYSFQYYYTPKFNS